MQAFLDWLLHPPEISAVPTEALVATASVAVVIWTGGFIVRGWMQNTSIGLMAGMNYLQYAFFAPLLGLMANALTLRCLALLFFLYYASFFARYAKFLRAREPEVELFLPYNPAARLSGAPFWATLQAIQLVPVALIFIWPDPRVLAWSSAGMTFLGYQIILAFVYNDLFPRPKR